MPNGKLLKVTVELKKDIIKDIQIKGDFFMHPEEAIEIIENAIRGKKIDKKLEKVIEKVFTDKNIEAYGLDSKSIFEAIKVARDEVE